MNSRSVRFRAGLILLALVIGAGLYAYVAAVKAEEHAQEMKQQAAAFYEKVQVNRSEIERLVQRWPELSDEQVRASLLMAANEMRTASLAVHKQEPKFQPVAALFDLYARVAEEWGTDFADGRIAREALHGNVSQVAADLERISDGPTEAEAFAAHWQQAVQELQTEEVLRLYRAQGY